jgi:hypothetical protein
MPPAHDSVGRSGSEGWRLGRPAGRHNPFTPEGEIEQVGMFASGAWQQRGRRRFSGRLLAVVVLAMILLPLIAAVMVVISPH